MYSLDCNYFDKEFKSIEELISYVMQNGVDPNLEITKNGKRMGEQVIDLISF